MSTELLPELQPLPIFSLVERMKILNQDERGLPINFDILPKKYTSCIFFFLSPTPTSCIFKVFF